MVLAGRSSTCESTWARLGCSHETQDPLCKPKWAKIKAFLKKAEFRNSFYFCKLLWNHEHVSEHIIEGNWYDTQNECIWDFTRCKSAQNALNVHLYIFQRPAYFTSNLLISMLLAFSSAKISKSPLKKRSSLGMLLTGIFFFLFMMIDTSVLLIYYSFPGGFPFWSIDCFFVGNFVIQKSSSIFTCVPILCLLAFFLQELK